MTMKQTHTSLIDAIDYLNAIRMQNIRRLTVVRLVWVALVLSILFFLIDSIVFLSGTQRLAIGITFIVSNILVFILSPRFLNRTKCKEKMLARLIESKHPDLNNVLVNAIDFDEKIKEQKAKDVSVPLMQKGINLAVDEFDKLETLEGLECPTMKAESKVLKFSIALWLFSAIVFYNWFLSEVPRFFDPYGDHPPYCPTQFVIEPAGTMIDYGQDLTINVTTKGKIPENLSLVFQSPDGKFLNELGTFNSGDGKFTQTIEDVRDEMVFYASINRGRSKYYKINLAKTPRIEHVLADYKFPEYTGLSSKTTQLSNQENELKGYQGTNITMTVKSNRPLAGGTVTVGKNEYQFEPDKENTVKADFPLIENNEFSVVLEDIEGNLSTDKFVGNIEIVPDGEPYITIVNPGMNSFAIPSAVIPIVIEAYDDLGVKNVSIVRSHNDSDDSQKVLSEPTEREEFVRITEMFDLGDLGVKPGDIIDYYALVKDTLPNAPQTAASDSFKIEIVSEEEYSQSMQERMDAEQLREKYDNILAQIEELIELQKELEEQTGQLQEELAQENADPNSQEIQNKLSELAKRQEELREKTGEVAQKLEEESQTPPVFDIEKEYKEALAEFAKSLDKAGEHMEKSAENINDSSPSQGGNIGNLGMAKDEQKKALEEMGEKTQQKRDAIQQANREIEKMYELMKDVSTFQQLYAAQENLARQTKTLSQENEPDLDTQIRLKELAEDEAVIKEELQNLKEQFREHASKIKEEYPDVAKDAEAIASEIEMRQIPDLMQQGESFLNEINAPDGHAKVQEAYEQMTAMIQFCKACSGGGCSQCAFRLKLMMMLDPGNTMQQLAQGLNIGMGMGQGPFGAFGRGAAGYGGGYSEFAMFGGDTFGRDHLRQSPMISARPRHRYSDVIEKSIVSNRMSGNIEELTEQEESDTQYEVDGQNRMMVEYNKLIEAYFQRLAEDN